MIALRPTRGGSTARSCASRSKRRARIPLLVLTAELAALVSAACGGSPSTGGPPNGNPTPTTYTIGGSVSGLTASGLVLQDNGGNNLSVSANGTFTFTGALDSGGAYSVTILTQPSEQNCSVTNGSGTATANVSNVQVGCGPLYTIGGTVSGLTGSGLTLRNAVGSDFLTISSNGAFTFPTSVSSGEAYSVSVVTQPSSPTQICVVSNASGTAASNVTNIQVSCANAYTISVTVSGLAGINLTLENNGGDNINVPVNGSFTFPTPLYPDTTYNVTVGTQPILPVQSCAVTNGSGTVTANVTGIQVTCTTVTFTIGGTVSGLSGTGLVLQDNGGDNLPISADGSFTFATAIDSGTAYDVSVATQPLNPVQGCGVANGIGTASGTNVTNVHVVCTNGSGNEWTWVSGPIPPSFGVEGTAAPSNAPPGLESAIGWPDTAGSLWFFGGNNGSGTYASAFWKYSSGEWTWVNGSDLFNQGGNYGTFGTAAPSNAPGSREGSASWLDGSGNFWLFGGRGYDPLDQNFQSFNDLWMYAGGEWTWVGGSSQPNQPGVYGTLGVAAPGNIPGARQFAVSWTDSTGNFWIFGGNGIDSANNAGHLNDLWEYSGGTWTWMGGSNLADQTAVYGVQGTASPNNIPGPRDSAVVWLDKSGNVWLFGGFTGFVSGEAGSFDLNDLWKYSAGEWTWIGGSDQPNQPGVYGVQGTAAPTNVPGARDSSVAWTDAQGNFWLFGGETGTTNSPADSNFNDLWKYSGGQWTWVNGANVCCQAGISGTQGTGAPSNTPGARYGAVPWIDPAGNLWLFGGSGLDTNGIGGDLNDLWKYQP
jgi:hypothetical protein